MSIKDMINQAQASMPAGTFTQDMSSAVQMRNQFPPEAFGGAVNGMMTGQINNTMADQANFPDQASDFEQNGFQSMSGAVGALHAGGVLDAVEPSTWDSMSQMSPGIGAALGFDPAEAARQPELASSLVAGAQVGASAPNNNGSIGQDVAQTGVDVARDGARTLNKAGSEEGLVSKVVNAQADLTGKEMDVAGDVIKGEGKLMGKEAEVAGKAASEGVSMLGKGAGVVADLAKSPLGKVAGKAALPLGIVGGAIALGSDAGTFGDAITDPFDSEKRDKAVKALREDSPIPGTPLVLDAITDPGKIVDTAKDVGKVFTHPSLDSLKDAGSSIADEFGF